MIGSYYIIVSNATVKYEFEIKRNITIIKGDSATGKTILIDMIRDLALNGQDSGVSLSCAVPCHVVEGITWEEQLTNIEQSIVFIDEGNRFVSSEEFARYVREGKNYYVLVTREKLSNLPYSVSEVYGIKSSGKYNDLIPVYHEMYHIYEEQIINLSEGEMIVPEIIIIEDTNAGYEFFEKVTENSNSKIECCSAGGKSKIYDLALNYDEGKSVLIIADGAAFGAEMDRIFELICSGSPIHLFLPESFEWLILNSGLVREVKRDEIESPENYADSIRYFSWERYFTDLIIRYTHGTAMEYSKNRLNEYFKHTNIIKRILATIKGIQFDLESEE